MHAHLGWVDTRTIAAAILPVATPGHVHAAGVHVGGAPGLRVAIDRGAGRVDSSCEGEWEDAVAARRRARTTSS